MSWSKLRTQNVCPLCALNLCVCACNSFCYLSSRFPAYKMMSCPSCLDWASDSKKPDPYYWNTDHVCNCVTLVLTTPKFDHPYCMSVVYFDQLLGMRSTQKLVKIHNICHLQLIPIKQKDPTLAKMLWELSQKWAYNPGLHLSTQNWVTRKCLSLTNDVVFSCFPVIINFHASKHSSYVQ